ncbi:MAG: L-seryl-tRNA(Sec) selenium transferase, partial [Planctomycetota bacterium]|nr:L-seryl-tRNA(Sec) selenium transferase [Planctomycetota bacterium]
MANDLLRKLPSVDRILNSSHSQALQESAGKSLFLLCLREELDKLRDRIRKGETLPVDEKSILENVRERVEREKSPALCRVINATGIILHTGLGRAILPPEAIAAISAEQKGYSLLEVDRETGDRSMRETEIVRLLKELTGAEAATVVNNNAGATLIALATLARGKEVIVSRGQLVEIGGSFRIPDVMEQSGAKLVEVGTTNKTNIQDYEKAITSETALLLKVHTSNYKIIGFTHTPSLDEMIGLGNR